MSKCNICKRELSNDRDPFSIDCGGDCVWCMIPIEFDIGAYDTVVNLLAAIAKQTIDIKILDEKGEF